MKFEMKNVFISLLLVICSFCALLAFRPSVGLADPATSPSVSIDPQVSTSASPLPSESPSATPTPTPSTPLISSQETPEPIADPLEKRPLMIILLSIALICTLLLLARIIATPTIRRNRRKARLQANQVREKRPRSRRSQEWDLVNYTDHSPSPLDRRQKAPSKQQRTNRPNAPRPSASSVSRPKQKRPRTQNAPFDRNERSIYRREIDYKNKADHPSKNIPRNRPR